MGDAALGISGKIIMDPVHGGIRFFEHEKAVINHPLFQRLRWIVQNDITSLVFPGASHTRFQHSLGAMHIAGRVWESIVGSYLIEAKKLSGSITEAQSGAIKYFGYCLRLAALLHDVGHFPFSHQIENSKKFKQLLGTKNIVEQFLAGLPFNLFLGGNPKHLAHEHFSVWCAYEILNTTKTETVDLHDVLCLMETTDIEPSKRFQDASALVLELLVIDRSELGTRSNAEMADVFKRFFQTIISGELDVDKMDYLLRDSFFSGCKYGVYNLDHLLSTIRIGFNFTKQEKWVGLAVTEKGIAALEDFVYSRFQLYQELYSHKTVVGFKWLLGKALDEVLDEKQAYSYAKDSLVDRNLFSYFTDTFLWEGLRAIASRQPKSASAQVLLRKQLSYISTKEGLADYRKEEEVRHLEKTGLGKVVYFQSPIKFSKISDPQGRYAKIRVLKKSRDRKRRYLVGINESTDFFEKFHDLSITHFYQRPDLV